MNGNGSIDTRVLMALAQIMGQRQQPQAPDSFEQEMYVPDSIAQQRSGVDAVVAGAGQDMSSMHDSWAGMKDPIAQIAARLGQLQGLSTAYGSGRGFSPARGPGVRAYAEKQAAPLQELLDRQTGGGAFMQRGQNAPAAAAPQGGGGGSRQTSGRITRELSQPAPQQPPPSYGNDMVLPPRMSSSQGNQGGGEHPLRNAVIQAALQYLNKRNPHRFSSL